ncbi:MAG: hypothetical protein GF418_11115 [Chitinivibrionales bacterium]|nr:hypothetical protein [Chitinivibrionales bacterium]MBD3396165.1 hypothetical protein [Chitinivibrionales bacterium]
MTRCLSPLCAAYVAVAVLSPFSFSATIDVLSSGVTGDGSNETSVIQAVIDGASAGDTLYFGSPPTAYGVASINVGKPLTLLGDGWTCGEEGREARTGGTFEGAEIRQVSGDGTIVSIGTSNATIDGLKIKGRGYTGPRGSNTVIYATGSKTNITVRNCWLCETNNRCIDFTHGVSHVVVQNNRIEDIHYVGVMLHEVKVAHVIGNHIEDLQDPVSGEIYHNGYGIVISGDDPAADAIPEDIILQDNFVKHVPEWHCINNHYGERVLAVDNDVRDAEVGLVKTYKPQTGLAGGYNLYINNYAENHTRNGSWCIGPRQMGTSYPYEQDNHFIGNTYKDVVKNYSRGQEGFRVHHEKWINPPTDIWYFANGHLDLHHSNNDPDGGYDLEAGQPLSYKNTFTTPDAPADLTVVADASKVTLTWTMTDSEHDSFELQRSDNGSTGWQTVAWRPPNINRWKFTSTNPNLVPFDPLMYIYRAANEGHYRIRAWNGNESSAWSNVSEAGGATSLETGVSRRSAARLSVSPQPVTARADISFAPASPNLRLSVHTLQGELVHELLDIRDVRAEWDASAYPNGMYVVRLQIGNRVHSVTMLVAR